MAIFFESVFRRSVTPAVANALPAVLSGHLSRHALGTRTGCSPSVLAYQSATLVHCNRLSFGLSHCRFSGAAGTRCARSGAAKTRTNSGRERKIVFGWQLMVSPLDR